MYDFKRLLVCLDHSEMDDTLIKVAAKYAAFGRADNIYFVTVARSLEVPDAVNRNYPDAIKPVDEQMKEAMKGKIKNHFDKINCDFHFDVLEGDPTYQIIHWADVKKIDLIVLGKKPYHIGKGVTARNIVNIVHCSALFVTTNSCLQPKSILVPTDFSKASHLAFQKAEKIAGIVKASLTCLHTYEVPTGFHATGKTYDEFAEIILTHSKDDFAEFLKQENGNLPEVKEKYLLDTHGHPDKLIADYVKSNKFDLLVVGSKGRTALSSVLLGSVAAKLVESDIDMMILVVKSKEENLKFIEALLRL